MRSRRGRLVLFILLLLAGVAVAVMTWDYERRALGLAAAARDLDARFERMIAAAGGIAAAQQAYVVPGQLDDTWFARVAALIAQLSSDVDAIRSRLRSADAAAALQTISDATRDLARLDAQVRENLRFSEDLIAADLIFSEGRGATEAAATELRALRDAEHAASAGEQAALARDKWTTLAAGALIWLGGLFLLMRTPTALDAPPAAAAGTPLPVVETRPAAAGGPTRPPVDLGAAADVCTAISRMREASELPGLLARAAAVLDASGVIVWIGAGEELFAAAAHGYDPRVVRQLGAIGRNADNATAAAWRSGQLTIVAGDLMSNGAVVAPMFRPDTCIGVLAAEVQHGREDDADTRAVTAVFAAQLAAAVVACPGSQLATVSEAPPQTATGS